MSGQAVGETTTRMVPPVQLTGFGWLIGLSSNLDMHGPSPTHRIRPLDRGAELESVLARLLPPTAAA